MKIELQRDSVLLEIQHVGRQLFITEGAASQTKGYFDVDEARAAFDALVADKQAQGWTASAAEQQKEQQKEQKKKAQEALAARIEAAQANPDAKAGARSLLWMLAGAPRFEDLIARVDAVDDEGNLLLSGGARITLGLEADPSVEGVHPWFRPLRALSCLWLYLDDHSNDHNLYFGAEAGPPEPESALEGTPFEHAAEWFIQEAPWDRYWFYVPDEVDPLHAGGDVAHRYDFDGGLQEEFRGPLADLLVLRLVTLLER